MGTHYPYQPGYGQSAYGQVVERPSLGELVSSLLNQTYDLFQQNIQLAKAELAEESKKMAKMTAYAIMGLLCSVALLIFAGGLLLLIFLAWGVDLVWAFALVTGVFLVLAVIMAGLGYREFRKLHPK